MKRRSKVGIVGAAALAGVAVWLFSRRASAGGVVQTGVLYDPKRGECGVMEDDQVMWFACTSREDGEAYARTMGYVL